MNQEIPLSGGDNITNVVDAQWGVAADVVIDVTELGPSFSESVNTVVLGNLSLSIEEVGPSFTEIVSATVPIIININDKNAIRVRRELNVIRVRDKPTIIRVQ